MNQIQSFPQISTRGRYDLRSGLPIDNKKKYVLTPRKKFDKILNAKEIVIFIHGMRNSRWGAKRGALTLRQTLRKLGYKDHPVVAFSYDADVRGAHLDHKYSHVIDVAQGIAIYNGIINLSPFIRDLKKNNPKIKIHLVGHSLGCIVAGMCVDFLKNFGAGKLISSLHLLGSPYELDMIDTISSNTDTKITNYYNPTDDVIIEAVDRNTCRLPTCLIKKVPHVKNVKCLAKNHSFRAYAKELKKFP